MTAFKTFAIENIDEPELLWSNTDGWVHFESNFDVFTSKEKETLNLPIGGNWIGLALMNED